MQTIIVTYRVLPVVRQIQERNKSVEKSVRFSFFIPFQRWRMHAPAWSIWSGWGDEVEQIQDEELEGSLVAGLIA